MSREGNSRKSNENNANMGALIAALESARMGTAESAVTHEAPKYVHRFTRRNYGKKKFTLAKPAFIPLSFAPVSVEYKRFPRTSLVNTKHKTAKLRALNIKRRRVMLGLKKKTRRPEQKSTRKSTRRRAVK